MNKWIIWLVLAMGLSFPRTSLAQEWDLKFCQEIGLKQSPKIQAATKGVEGADARVRQSLADYYPSLYAESDYVRYKGSFSVANYPPPAYEFYVHYLGLSQNIYDFGRREYKVQSSREDLKTYQWDLKDIRLSVIDEIRQAYFGVLLTRRVSKVRQEDLDRTRVHFEQARAFYQVGLKAKIDATQAEVEFIKSQKALLKAQNDAKISIITLSKAMGFDRPPAFSLKDNLETERVVWQLDDLQKEAMERHTALNRLRSLIKYWEAQEKWATREFWPKLTGNARYGNAGYSSPSDEVWNVGLQLNFPFFSGFQSQAKLVEIRAALGQAKAHENALRLQILNDLQSQFLNQQLTEKQIEVARESLRSAKDNWEQAMGRYKSGIGAMLEVTDARVSYSQAENDYVQALYDYQIVRYQIEKTIGRE
jgi:outer membrane protein TolC